MLRTSNCRMSARHVKAISKLRFFKALLTSVLLICFFSIGGPVAAQIQAESAAQAAKSAADAAQAALDVLRQHDDMNVDSICTGGSTFENSECLNQVLNATKSSIKKAMVKVKLGIANNEGISSDIQAQWTADANAAQKAWNIYRDKECERIIYQSYGGAGGGAGNMMTRCQIEKTLRRIEEIRRDYDLADQ